MDGTLRLQDGVWGLQAELYVKIRTSYYTFFHIFLTHQKELNNTQQILGKFHILRIFLPYNPLRGAFCYNPATRDHLAI